MHLFTTGFTQLQNIYKESHNTEKIYACIRAARVQQTYMGVESKNYIVNNKL